MPAAFDINFNEERDVYSLRVTIRNDGSVAIPKFKLNFYQGDPVNNLDENGKLHSGWHEAGPIESGKNWNERTADFRLQDGEYEFNAVLNYDGGVNEVDKNNNRASIKVVIRDGQIVEKKVGLIPANISID